MNGKSMAMNVTVRATLNSQFNRVLQRLKLCAYIARFHLNSCINTFILCCVRLFHSFIAFYITLLLLLLIPFSSLFSLFFRYNFVRLRVWLSPLTFDLFHWNIDIFFMVIWCVGVFALRFYIKPLHQDQNPHKMKMK